MAALTADPALIARAQCAGLPMAAQAATFECRAQHPSEFIFAIERHFFAKAGRKNQGAGVR